MQFSTKMYDQLNLLLMFPTDSLMQGLKIHHDADPKLIEAAKSLYELGVISLPDGGYLTDLGLDLIEHAQVIKSALTPSKH
ncbi:TIGR02647 family protein [Alteromonadaceae bacterium M269]|nr:TIGR02647 family protein [Alteromonadaceae bacterium M269]